MTPQNVGSVRSIVRMSWPGIPKIITGRGPIPTLPL